MLITYFTANLYVISKLTNSPILESKNIIWKFSLILISFIYIFIKIYLKYFDTNIFILYLNYIGSFYLALINYLLFIYIFINIISILNKTINIFSFTEYKFYMYGTIFAILIVLLSHINIYFPITKEYNIKTDKKLDEKVKIVMISDMHLSNISVKWYWDKVVNMINKIDSDYIIIAGDILDTDVKEINRVYYNKLFLKLQSKKGIYGVMGNHDYFGNIDNNRFFLSESNINILEDEYVELDNINIIGRKDKSYNRTGNMRKNINDIILDIDNEKYNILIDHTPNDLNVAVENGIDLQLSGHTHNGQFFPWNLVTKRIFEVARGHIVKEKTDVIVSSGIGVWGPPIRNSSRPEIIIINIEN